MSVINIGQQLLQRDLTLDDAGFEGWAQREAESSGMFANLGGLLGSLLPVIIPTIGKVLAPLTAGISVPVSEGIAALTGIAKNAAGVTAGLSKLGTAAWAGIGSGIGSYAGGQYGANRIQDYDAHFRRTTRAQDRRTLEDKLLADAIGNATMAASTSYAMGLTGNTEYMLDPHTQQPIISNPPGGGPAAPEVLSSPTSFLNPTGGVQSFLGKIPESIGSGIEGVWNQSIGKGGLGLTGSGGLLSKLNQSWNPWASMNIPGMNNMGGNFVMGGPGAGNQQMLTKSLQNMNAGSGASQVIQNIFEIGSNSIV